MPVIKLAEEYMVAKTRPFLTLRDSVDVKVSKAGNEVRTGRMRSVYKAVEHAESSLQHQVIVDATKIGRKGKASATVDTRL